MATTVPQATYWRLASVVGIVALLSRMASVMNGFTQDDISILLESTRLHDLSAWKDIVTMPYWPPPVAPDLYRPVTSFLLALQYMIGGGAPGVFRLISIGLYIAACMLLFALARRLLPGRIAFAVAAIFAAHPLHSEAVTLAVAQPEILVAILAMGVAIRYIDRRRGPGLLRRDWMIIGAAYLVACLTKEHGLVLPALLVAAELFVLTDATPRVRLLKSWKGFASLAAIGSVSIAVRTAVLAGAFAASFVADALKDQSLWGRGLTMLQLVPQWTRLLLWPVHLRAEYSPGEFVASARFGGAEGLGAAILIVVVSLTFYFRDRSRAVAFGISWTAIALLPVSNVLVPTGILIAERTLLLASIGSMIAIGGLVSYATDRAWYARVPMPRVLMATTAVLVIGGIGRSASRQRIWEDADTLTIASFADSPRSWRVQQSYGEMMFNVGNADAGRRAFDLATILAPESWRPRNRLAERLWQVRDDEGALTQLQLSAKEYPGRVETLSRLPAALIAVGRYTDAKRLADSVIVAERAPPLMVFYREVADSALVANAPAGSVRLFPSP